MQTIKRMGSCIGGALALVMLGPATSFAGDLTPPAGPIQATDAVAINQSAIASFPYVIDTPGVYRFTSDLNLIGGGTAIFIEASDVTLDLGGFTLRTDTPGAIGIRAAPPTTADATYDNLTIKNGTLEGLAFGFLSSNAPGAFSTLLEHTTVRDLTVRGCASAGLVLADHGRVVDCRFYDNGGFGLFLDKHGVVERCDFAENNTGISIEQYGVVRDCHFRGDSIAIASGGVPDGHVIVDGNTFVRCTTRAIDFSTTSGHFIVRNIVEDCGATPIVAPGSQVPIATDAATAGPYDNIVP